ncbi:hypothetical protein ACEWY4_017518 [Coilia grayii]|uniref:Interferon-induced protein 44-like n=1 Tax=Coilia grayii TaxID=363190 RepID=A0ABD1JHC5_9TELE
MSFFKKLFQSEQPPSHPLMDDDWRTTYWERKDEIIDGLRSLEVSNKSTARLHILLVGPVSAGKSSFINSIDSIFQGRMTCAAITDASSNESFTKMYQTHKIKNGIYGHYLPFVISDTMGLEEGYSKGLDPNYIVQAMQGQLKDGHVFSAGHPCVEKATSPTLDDKIHCLVMVVPAHTMTMVQQDVIEKIRDIREKATELKIPQVALLTKVDEACPEVKKDLRLVYRSKKIELKMTECHNRLGVNLSHIYPVKNYHKEAELSDDMDVLLLTAFKNILNFANDHVAEIPPTED